MAALSVVIAHSALAYVDGAGPRTGALAVLLRGLAWPAHPAVVLFFVLSGFVLYIAFDHRPDVPYWAYLVRRFFRIVPVLAAGLLIALAIHQIQHPVASQGLGKWVTFYWVFATDIEMVARNLLLLGVDERDRLLDPVLWSLAIELRFSIVFVALALLVRRSPWALFALALVAYLVGFGGLVWLKAPWPYQVGHSWLGAIAVTLFYLPGFCFGILAAHHVRKASRPLPAWMAFATFAVLGALGQLFHDDALWGAAFAALIVLASRPGRLHAALTSQPVTWLGDISYDLYVIHFPILMALAYALHTRIGLLPAVLIAPPVALLASPLLRRFVEIPGMKLGKALAGRRSISGTNPVTDLPAARGAAAREISNSSSDAIRPRP